MTITENRHLPTPAFSVIAVVGWIAVIYLAYVGAHDALMRTLFSVATLTSNMSAEVASHPFEGRYVQHPWMTLLHSLPGFLFMTLGPLQFMSSIRKRWIHLHRKSGRIYLGVCILVAIGAISMGFALPIWGWTALQWGTFGYSLLLLFFVFKAYWHIRARQFAKHREWMIRGFATGLAIATFRVTLGDVLLPIGVDFTTAWNTAALISFPINLAAAELWIRATRPKKLAAVDADSSLVVPSRVVT